jgi:hypothetical protein
MNLENRKYCHAIKNNIISGIHSVFSCILSGYYLGWVHKAGTKYLYDVATNSSSLILNNNSNTSNTANYDANYDVNMRTLYNQLISSNSLLLGMTLFSITYFIFDSLYYIRRNLITEKWLFLYHHMITILLWWCVYNTNNSYEYLYIFYYGELSNFFNYITYHLIKTNQQNAVFYSKLAQVIWFLYFRGYVFSSILLPFCFSIENIFMKISLPTIYILGLIWGFQQIVGVQNMLLRNLITIKS